MLPALLLFVTAAAAVDNSAQVDRNIITVQQDIRATNATFAAYTSFSSVEINAALDTYNAANQLSVDLQTTIDSAQSSTAFSADGSEDVFVDLTAVLPPTFELLDNIIRYCNAYVNLSVQSLVFQQLSDQSALTSQLASAIRAKSADKYKPLIDFGTGLLNPRFARAVSIYSVANERSTCPPPGATDYPSAGGTRTVTITAPGRTITTGAPGATRTVTITAPGRTITTGAPGATRTVTITAPGRTITKGTGGATVTKTTTKTVTAGSGPGKTVTITKGPTVTKTLPPKTVTTHCTVTVTKTKTIQAPPQYCPH